MQGLPGNPTTNINGYYNAMVAYGWSGTVTPNKSGYTFNPPNRPYSNVISNQTNQNYTGTSIVGAGDDLLGTWDGSGVYYRNSQTGNWIKMSPPAHLVAAGDLDGDGTDDLLWSKAGDGVWVKLSSTKTWMRHTPAAAGDMTSGDMNGNGRDDIVGNWTSGVYYKDSLGGGWVKMAPPADLISAGDLDGDGTEDLLWSKAGDGVWVKHSSTGKWIKLIGMVPVDIASGDMNGDGRDDLIGSWSSGVYYKNSIGGSWVKMAPPASLIGAGDLDKDGRDDLLWSKAGDGVWVKRSATGSWMRLTPATARHMDAGLMRGGANPWPSAAIDGFMELPSPRGGYIEGPGSLYMYDDLSDWGPGGRNFFFREEENLFPKETDSVEFMRIPGPGEPGFQYIEEKNLIPTKKGKRKTGK
jgi:hypothetical protein